MEEAAVQAYLKSYVKATTPESPDDGVLLRNGHQAERTIFPDDVEAEVFDWILSHLESRQCLLPLATLLAKTVSQKLSSSLKLGGESSLDWNTLQADALDTLQALCTMWTEQPQLVPLGLAPLRFPVSVNAVRNSRRKMEDRHIALPYFNYAVGLQIPQDGPQHCYYAVFDGHAGVEAAAYATAHLHHNIAQHPDFLHDPIVAIREGFATTERNFLQRSSKEGMKSGCTAVCCLLREDNAGTRLYTGWLGDSQAVLVRRGMTVPLVEPHKPDREDEKKRIEELGGTVLFMGTWRVNGALAVSRALGDAEHKPYVSSDPDVSFTDLDGTEDFLVLGCDGLWDQLDPDDVAAHVYRSVARNPGEVRDVAHSLVQKARERGSTDNITAVVVFLRDMREFPTDFPFLEEDERMAVDYEPSTPPAFDADRDELRHAANEVVLDTIETALHRMGYPDGFIRENGEMQTAQNIVEQVHQLHSGVRERFHGAVPIEDALGEDGNIGIENPGFGGNPFETRGCDAIQDEFKMQNWSAGQRGYLGTEVADGFGPANPFSAPKLATSPHTEAAEQQSAELQPTEEPHSPPIPKEPLDEFAILERAESPSTFGREEHEPFPADSEDFASFIENAKQAPLQDIQEHKEEGLLTEAGKFEVELDDTRYHERGDLIEPDRSFGTQDLQGLPASSVDTGHLEDISGDQQFDMMSEDLVSVDLDTSVAQPLGATLQGANILGHVTLPHPTQPMGEEMCHGIPEPTEATRYQDDFQADGIDEAEDDIVESLSPAVSADSVVGSTEECQTSAVIFCELKEPASAPVSGGECGLVDDFKTLDEEMARIDGDFVSQLPVEPDSCQQVSEFHQEAPLLHKEVPELHQEAPLLHKEVPESYQEAPQLHREVPESYQDAPQLHREVPESYQDAAHLHREVPESYQDAAHLHREVPESYQDASQLHEVPEFHQEVPQFHQEETVPQPTGDQQQYLPESDQGLSFRLTSEPAKIHEPATHSTEPTEELSDICSPQPPLKACFVDNDSEPLNKLEAGTVPLTKESNLLREVPEQELHNQGAICFGKPETIMMEPTEPELTACQILPDLVVPESPEVLQPAEAELGITDQLVVSGTAGAVESRPDVTGPVGAELGELEPIQHELVTVTPAKLESVPVHHKLVAVTPAEPEPTPLHPEAASAIPAGPESAPTEDMTQLEDVAEHERVEAVVCELLAVAEAEERKQPTVQETEVKQPTAQGEDPKPTALEDTVAPVDLGTIPEGVPEADGVTEDSDSEKDGGWKFVKPVAAAAAAVVATVAAVSVGDAAVPKVVPSQQKASPLAKPSPSSQKRVAPPAKTPAAKGSPGASKLSADKAPAKPAHAKASPKPAARSPISPATSRPIGTSKKPTETSTKPASTAARKPVPATTRPSSALTKPSDKPTTKPRPVASAALPAKTKEAEKPSSAPLRSTVTKTTTKATTSTLGTSTRTASSALGTATRTSAATRPTAPAPATRPASASSRTATLQVKKLPEAAGLAKPPTRTTASVKLNKDNVNQQLSTAKKAESTANRVASARMAASASQKAAAASKTLKQNATKTSKQTVARTSEGAATAIKPKRAQVQQNGICEEKGSLEQMENKTATAKAPLSNGTVDKSALGDVPPEV